MNHFMINFVINISKHFSRLKRFFTANFHLLKSFLFFFCFIFACVACLKIPTYYRYILEYFFFFFDSLKHTTIVYLFFYIIVLFHFFLFYVAKETNSLQMMIIDSFLSNSHLSCAVVFLLLLL